MNRSNIAVMAASQRAHNPYRTNSDRVQLTAPRINFKTRIVSKILKLFTRVIAALRVWQKPACGRNIRRAVRTSSVQAKNKADPHLEKRV